MKKVICLLMIFSLFLSGFIKQAQAESLSDYADDINLLSDIGIIDLSTFKTDVNITRAQFCMLLTKALNIDKYLNYDFVYFTDVPKNHEAFNQIMYSVSQGYISGYDDNTFRPDEYLMVRDALVILVTTLGYKYKALSLGGYPTGYEMSAVQLGITAGLKEAYNQQLSAGGACRLLYNAINIPLVIINSVGNNERYTIDNEKTIMTEYLKLKADSGIVNANEFAGIKGKSITGENQILIDNMLFYIHSEKDKEMLGLKVNYIYKLDTENDVKELVSLRKHRDNKELTIDINNYIEFKNNVFYYYLSDEKTGNISVSKTSDIIKNSENINYYDDMFDDIIYGNLRFISTGNNNIYDLIIINEFENIIVGNVNNTELIVSDKDNFSKSICFDPDLRAVEIYDFNGNQIQFSNILLNDVITYKESEKLIIAYVGNPSGSGIIEEKYFEDYEILLDNKSYKLSPGLYDRFDYLKIGENIKIYLDYFGNIAYFNKQLISDSDFIYLINLGSANLSFDEVTVFGKFYVSDKGLVNIKLAKKLYVNGELYKNYTRETITDVISNDGGENVEQLVRVEFNEENEISHLDTAKKISDYSAGEDGFCKTHEAADRTLLVTIPSFDFDIYLKKNTPILLIPNNALNANERDFDTLYAEDFENYKIMNVEAYARSKEAEYSDILIYRGENDSSSIPDVETPVSLFCYKTIAIGADGEQIERIYYIQNNKEGYVDLYPEDEVKYTYETNTYKPTDMRAGDVFTFKTSGGNRMTKFRLFYKANEDLWTTINIHTSYKATDRYTVMQVSKINSNFITFSKQGFSDQRYKIAKFNIVVVDLTGEKARTRIGDINDVQIGDKAFIQVLSRNLRTIILYKIRG